MLLVLRYTLFLWVISHFAHQSALGQTPILKNNYKDAGDTEIEITSIFGAAGRFGTVPYRVRIRNNSGADRTWNVLLEEGDRSRNLSTSVRESIQVENGTEVIREMLLPMAPAFTTYSYRSTSATVSAQGLPKVTRNHGHQTNDRFPTLAMSRELSRRSLVDLDDHIQTRGNSDSRFASAFDPKQLPTRWRAYTSLDALLIDQKSWERLSGAQQNAVIEWVRLGGRLEIFAEGSNHSLKSLSGVEGVVPSKRSAAMGRLSLGTVQIRAWDGDQLPTNVANSFDRIPKRAEELENLFDQDWQLNSAFGIKKFNAAIILIPLLIFAILVAPVNLFYFARKGKRHRLFFTTPIISVAACIMIVAVIFLEDGVGGRGYRTTLLDLQPHPGEMRIYLSQEQISRTGVMLNSGFNPSLPLVADPVSLPNGAFNPLSRSSNRKTRMEFFPDEYRGGFFRSRSEQGFSLRASTPSRSRISQRPQTTASFIPDLVSNLSTPLTEFFFRDADGRVWKLDSEDPIAPGDTIPLRASAQEELTQWLQDKTSSFSKAQRSRIRRLNQDSNRFFASAQDPQSLAIATHPSITWERDLLVLTGSIHATSTALDSAP
ncbi:MAG: hypothetical protein AAGA96_14415 [Verrucomicrobiota bacterium]